MSIFKKKISLFWMLPVVLLSVLITFMTTYVVMKVQAHLDKNNAYLQSTYTDDPTFAYVKQLFEQNYIGDVPEFDSSGAIDSLIREYLAASGDRWANYMNAEEYKAYADSMQGNLVGIGVQVTYDTEGESIEILLVMPDSPAEKIDIQIGDRIVGVNGKRVADIGYNAVVDAIKGEAGTEVKLTILRDGKEIELTTVRGQVTSLSVIYELLSDKKTGFIRILEFNGVTAEQFNKAVDDLLKKGAKQFVFDLRNNPGGQLDSVLSVLDRILPKDLVLIRVHDAAKNEETHSSKDDAVLDCPMAILINGSTASAAELFTSCLRDYEKATIVGEKSFGKGCMQFLYTLPNGGAVSFTTRLYSPPLGENYDGKGIAPHVEASLSEEALKINFYKLNETNDDQLKAALAVLGGLK